MRRSGNSSRYTRRKTGRYTRLRAAGAAGLLAGGLWAGGLWAGLAAAHGAAIHGGGVRGGEAVARGAAARAPATFRVYATREGLVGAGTADGHVITRQDHFVALPSRRSLDRPGSGDNTVRICAPQTGRCEYSPVWDVGPWNTADDYWDPRPARQMWPGLPTGVPESESAYLRGFNRGRDQFGRAVLNPAGVDVADGTMRRGLHLAGSAWVKLTMLWTGRYRHRVLIRFPWHGLVAVRTRPTWYSPKVGLAVSGANVDVACEARGQWVAGTHGRTDLWDRIGRRNWLPHAYVSGTLRRIAPYCRGLPRS